ncbi:MAG: hypothetical protein EG826_12035 [Deltaproteobacteria bacterium]|nr:hypothetical protein [Deltaproteobacteria bacterium]
MDSVSSYFSANPAVFTLIVVCAAVLMLFFIFKKLLKLTIVFVFVVLLAVGVYFFKDPSSMPDKIKQSVEDFKSGGEQIGDKFASLFEDTKKLAGKAKEVPKDLNKMLDTAKDSVGK